MPAIRLQSKKLETLRKMYVAAIKALPIAQSQKATAIAQSKSLTRDMLIAQLGGAVTQSSSKAAKQAAIKRQSAKRQSLKKVSAGQSAGAGRFSAKLQAKRQSQKQAARQSQKQAAAARASAKKRKSRKSRKGASIGKNIQIPKGLRARVGRLVRAIKAGKIVAKQQRGIAITSPSSYAPIGARDASGAHGRYERFDALYKGVRVTRKSLKSRKSRKSNKVARMSVKKRFQTIKEQKFPYQLVKGYRVPARVVGGGGSGAGVIKAIPGSGAAPFHSLSAADQAKVAAFLNAAGAKLRGKGAPKKVALQAMRQQAAKQVARRASIKSRKSRKSAKKGAANR
jgi:hypothetical protein